MVSWGLRGNACVSVKDYLSWSSRCISATSIKEVGPVLSLNRQAMKLLVPCDEVWPMGWGLDVAWSYQIADADLPMGIVDATPVVHNFRESAGHYDWRTTDHAIQVLRAERKLGDLADTMVELRS